jgi:nicotinic acid mononucleotide adenylyltransferase
MNPSQTDGSCDTANAPRIGYYIGSFDPPTLAHRAAVIQAIRHFGLVKVYITVNHNTDKDFNASIAERMRMLQLLFADQGDTVVILREPLEGRREFARWVLRRHPGEHLIGIFGDDTFEKNFKIFAGEPRFDFVRIARPMSTAECASDTYVPVVYDIMLKDADGLSSSEARRRISLGLDTSDILSPEVTRFIGASSLYPNVPADVLKVAEEEFLERWSTFQSRLTGVISYRRRKSLPVPSFKACQSKEGQSDKLVRHVVEALTMPLADQFRQRPRMERLLGIRYTTRPMTWRAGVYLGSFDPPGAAQVHVVEAALEQGSLDQITVGVLSSSLRKLSRPVSERLQLARKSFERFGQRVSVVQAPPLEESADFVRQLRNEQLEPLLAVFGANVFSGNYARLRALENLRYAVAPMAGVTMPDLPAGSLVLNLASAQRL